MGDFEFDIDLWKPGPCCGTRRMIYTKAETKRKRHGHKFLFVLKKTSKLYERLKKPILLSIAIIYWTQPIEIHTNMFFFISCIPMYIQSVSRLVDITAGGDCVGLCDQKSLNKHVPDFGRLRSYGHFLIPVHALVWTASYETSWRAMYSVVYRLRKPQRATRVVHNRAAACVAAGGGIFENQL